MKSLRCLIPAMVSAIFLAGCAGPAPKTAPTAPVSASPTPAAANLNAHRFYIVTFDANGIPHDRTGAVVDRERVRFLVNRGDFDKHAGIRIEVPKGITDRQKTIEAFARAQQVAKIFDLLGFEAVVVVLAE